MKKLFQAGFIFFLFCSEQPGFAQSLTSITNGKMTFRPVVKNNRVLWFDTKLSNQGTDQINLSLFENGKNKEITTEASALFTGWPDLDALGNITYMKKMGGRHEVFLYDGKKEIKITNNASVKNSIIDMGLGSDKVICGYPRINKGNIVFRDKLGNIYLYNKVKDSIRKISINPAQTANLGDDDEKITSTGITPPLNAHHKYVEFDGSNITWMHEVRGAPNSSKIFIYMAKADAGFKPVIIDSFEAWVPNNRGTTITKLWNPFFRACNGFIIWQYYLPGPSIDIDNTQVGFYDGKTPKLLNSKTNVASQSVQVADGKAIWWQIKKKGEGKNVIKFDELILYQNGELKTIVSYAEPPKKGTLNETYWEGIQDAEIIGGDIFWVVGETNCFQQFKMPVTNELYCMYKKTDRIAFFRSSSSSSLGSTLPFKITDTKSYAGGGEFSGELYAFFNNTLPSKRDITVMRLVDNVDTSAGTVSLVDLKELALVKWELYEEERKTIIDAFSISLNSQIAECGKAGAPKSLILEGITLDVLAEKKPTTTLEDIVSVSVYLDMDKNGKLDTSAGKDWLVGKKKKPVSTKVEFVISGTGIILKTDDPVYFLVELELIRDLCPCGKYKVTVDAKKLTFRGQQLDTSMLTGKSIGGIEMLTAEILEIKGDAQAELPNKVLPDSLALTFRSLPIRCAKLKFNISSQPKEKGSLLMNGTIQSATELSIELKKKGSDATGGIRFKLGKEEGLYTILAALEMPEGISCDNERFPFREHAGTMIVQVLDMNNPSFYTATEDKSNPASITWKSMMSDNKNNLSTGGEERIGATADGASMLLIRCQFFGLDAPPKGNIELSISGQGTIGYLSPGVGEPIPTYSGSNTINIQWVKTTAGIFGFALYTPPLNYGYELANNKPFMLRAVYNFPGTDKPYEKEINLELLKPPVALIHGMWSNKETWGPAFINYKGQFETFLIDYEKLAARNFFDLGHVVKNGVREIVHSYRLRRIAATRVSAICHSMGGLITRQFFTDKKGADYFRKDNFGQGDIYKLVTLGTPHYGSPVAWMTKKMRDAAYSPFLEFTRKIGMDIESGAIDGMCPGNPSLEYLGETHIPSHTVRAWNFDSKAEGFTWDDFYNSLKQEIKDFLTPWKFKTTKIPLFAIILFFIKYSAESTGGILLSNLYSGDKTDMLVTLEGQSGGIAQGGNTIFSETIHFAAPLIFGSFFKYCETTSQAVADYIFDVLNRDRNDIDYFAPKLPKPIIQDPATSCK